MKNIKIIILGAMLYPVLLRAQTVTFNGIGNLLIPPGAPAQSVGVTQSGCAVSGVGIIGGCVTIEQVEINAEHSWVGDVGILLIGPGGQVLELTTGNGGSGNNWTNTVFSDNAGAFITTGTPPYTGTFRPEGRVTNLNNPYSNAPALGTHTFASTYNGTNGDGIWTLYINDYVTADVGILLSWSITFNIGGTPPVADAGPDQDICPGSNATLTATGGGTYAWSNGATTASTMVMPLTTTTYTVTVSSAGCGTSTDQVTINVTPSTVSIDASPAYICPGENATLTASSSLPNFSWSTGDASSSITVGQPGIYTVTVSNGSGCTATASVNVPQRPLPTVALTTSVQNTCPGNCLTINANLTGTGPFSLGGSLLVNGTPVENFTQTFNALNGTFTVCVPPGVPTGTLTIQSTSLTDSFCTCN